MSTEVSHNESEQRYEIHVDGELGGYLVAQPDGDVVTLPHTEIDERFEGQGLASQLVTATLEDIRSHGQRIRPTCPYVKQFLEKHTEYADLVAE
ncbi:GNAT family N-acetyltransferase [Aeromicrobium piscarium]|uniref:N-acetyltransferase n=1 Tax=Aeromicrobium piscarium TaxID=2590901 RepID=A0A554RNY8_9ACTN|nr:GNAT family N-acetyltransferase [Aeromicrobium piscarium]TSD55796.1 N-acetyltransferase [Aeromicrobium piscarium]